MRKSKRRTMAVDLRQVIAALLTISMFGMLLNMIKKDHIDPLLVNVPISSRIQYDLIKVSKQHVKFSRLTSGGPWKEDVQLLKPCWVNPSTEVRKEAKGYIYFSLTNGPENHAFQISKAIIIAKHLGATLVLPDIIGVKATEKRHFGEVYDINKFLTSLDGVIQVVKDYPANKHRDKNIITVRVPNRITKEFIAENIEPLFKRHTKLRISSHFNSPALESEEKGKYMTPYECLVQFRCLELQPKLLELVDSMVRTLQHLGSSSAGKFIAVDWNSEEILKNKKGCQMNITMNNECFDGKNIGQFLKKIGFGSDTVVYLTQTGWHESLNSLREYFPNTFTKHAIIPIDMKEKYLGRNKFEFGKFIDFKLCTKSDVFIPTFHNLFQVNVAGMRIATGKTQIYELPRRTSATSRTDYLSPYISKKTHTAYSCFC